MNDRHGHNLERIQSESYLCFYYRCRNCGCEFAEQTVGKLEEGDEVIVGLAKKLMRFDCESYTINRVIND
jgi:hypothetical protein